MLDDNQHEIEELSSRSSSLKTESEPSQKSIQAEPIPGGNDPANQDEDKKAKPVDGFKKKSKSPQTKNKRHNSFKLTFGRREKREVLLDSVLDSLRDKFETFPFLERVTEVPKEKKTDDESKEP